MKNFKNLYASFWVIPRRLEFMCRRFGILCLFHFHRQVGMNRLWRWNRQSVRKRRHINSRRRVITQKKAYNIQNTVNAWNKEIKFFFCISTILVHCCRFVCGERDEFQFLVAFFQLLIFLADGDISIKKQKELYFKWWQL